LLGVDVLMSCVLQDDLKKFVSQPQPPPHGIEIPEEGKAKAKERREIGEGDDTVIVEDTTAAAAADDGEETLQDRFQLRSRFSRPGLPHVPLVQDPPASLEASLAAPPRTAQPRPQAGDKEAEGLRDHASRGKMS
jgi:hypothetical protein